MHICSKKQTKKVFDKYASKICESCKISHLFEENGKSMFVLKSSLSCSQEPRSMHKYSYVIWGTFQMQILVGCFKRIELHILDRFHSRKKFCFGTVKKD